MGEEEQDLRFRKVFMGGEEIDFDHIKKGDKFQIHVDGGQFQFSRADGDAFELNDKPGNAGVKISLLGFGDDDELKWAYS